MNLTVAMPYTASGWQVDNKAISNRIAYNHHERQLAMRMTEYQHEHAGEVISTMHVHATHEECVESVVIRGRAEDVVTLSRRLSAEPGVRHGRLNLIPVTPDDTHEHAHEHAHSHDHDHHHGH